jgi:hypothetical protein
LTKGTLTLSSGGYCLSRRRDIRAFDESHQAQQLAAHSRQTRLTGSARAYTAAAKPSARAFKRRRFSFERINRIPHGALTSPSAQVFEL